MPKLRRDAKTLKGKAISSLRRALECFNSFDEDGRVTSTLLHLQHATEMLLKAVLIQSQQPVFDKKQGVAIGFDRAVGLCCAHCGLTEGEAGTLKSIDRLRDAAQHWLIFLDEEILYLHARALVTIFDDILKRSLDDELLAHLPGRILPISTMPPQGFDLLIDRQYQQIQELLAPGRRARDEARGRIRALLAMEAHVVDEVSISEKDIDRVEKAIRGGQALLEVFPRLTTIETQSEGEGLTIRVQFTKRQGAPVRFVGGDDPEAAAAVREVDLQRKFHLSAKALAQALKLTEPRSKALRDHLKIDEDAGSCHVFQFGKSKFLLFSDNAKRRMTDALAEIDMDQVWAEYRANTGFGGRR